jgi:ABC-2 type transport system ATP-binding protein
MAAVELAVEVGDLVKVYEPSPRWMGVLLRSAITEPVFALRGISLEVAPGEICAIVGPNGAGKSTLFRVLTGLTTPSSGFARVHGLDATTAPRAVRALIGFVPAGDQSLYLRLSCVDNLLFHGRLTGLSGLQLRRRMLEVLELVGLGAAGERVGFALSAGMRARLQLARALLHEPSVLILDEPTAAVDPVGSYELLGDIQKVAREDNVAVLISSHRLEEIEVLRHRVILMDSGLIAYDGDLAAIAANVDRRKIRLRFASEAQNARARCRLQNLAGVDVVQCEDLSMTELIASDETRLGTIVTYLDGELDGLIGLEESQLPIREAIYSVLQRHNSGEDGGV